MEPSVFKIAGHPLTKRKVNENGEIVYDGPLVISVITIQVFPEINQVWYTETMGEGMIDKVVKWDYAARKFVER